MKTIYTFLIVLISTLCLAQESQKPFINYQGVASDANGSPLADTNINIRIALKFGDASSDPTYVENHLSIPTNSNGVFSLKIGEGTVESGSYNNLSWGNEAAYLTVSLNGAEVGTTEMLAVPYALSSADNQWDITENNIINKNQGNVVINTNLQLQNGTAINEISSDVTLTDNSNTAIPTEQAVKTYVDANSNATGLEALDEGNGLGWRLKGRDPDSFGNIGLDAIDFSTVLFNGTEIGASGNYSFATGANTKATGISSTALGLFSEAQGQGSIAMGLSPTSIGEYSLALGTGTQTNSVSEMAVGRYNTIQSGNASIWDANDRLFVVGNGVGNDSRSDALTIYKNGNTKLHNDLEVEGNTDVTGNVNVTGKVTHTDTGNYNMLPAAYGNISSSGNAFFGTENFTIQYFGLDEPYHYKLYLNGKNLNSTNSMVIISPASSVVETVNLSYGTDMNGVGYIEIILIDQQYSDINTSASQFSFLLYYNESQAE